MSSIWACAACNAVAIDNDRRFEKRRIHANAPQADDDEINMIAV